MKDTISKLSPTKQPSRGLGDTVAKAIHIASLGKIQPKKDCGCKKRQEKLNNLFPYKK